VRLLKEIGIYGDAVQRSAYRDAKVRTLLETAQQVLSPGARAPALLLTDDAGREHRQPAVVLVSNNPYALDQPVARGTRPALDSGKLGILVLDVPADRPHPPARAWTATYLEVEAPATVHAGIDGEAADLSGPLRFVIRPASLRVRISRRHQRGWGPRGLRLGRLPVVLAGTAIPLGLAKASGRPRQQSQMTRNTFYGTEGSSP
jgi:hypothetical protein